MKTKHRWPRIALPIVLSALFAPGCATTATKKQDLTGKDVIQIRVSMARTMVEQKDHDRALPYLRALLADNLPPGPAIQVRLLLAIVLRDKAMYKVAEREVLFVLKQQPKNARAHNAYGVLLDKMGRHDAAERHHKRAVKLAPRLAAFRNDLGFCLFLRRKLEDAEEQLREAISLDPSMRRAFNNLGFVLGLQGNREASMNAFQQAGSTAMALTNMGVVAEMRGQPQMARRYYERALRHQHDYKPALANLRALEPEKVPQKPSRAGDRRGSTSAPSGSGGAKKGARKGARKGKKP